METSGLSIYVCSNTDVYVCHRRTLWKISHPWESPPRHDRHPAAEKSPSNGSGLRRLDCAHTAGSQGRGPKPPPTLFPPQLFFPALSPPAHPPRSLFPPARPP